MRNKNQSGLFNNLRISIFLKFFLIWLAAGLAVFGLVSLTIRFQFNEKARSILNKNLDNYFSYLAQQIGSPPDTSLARQLAAKNVLEITYSSSTLNWSTVPEEKTRPTRFFRRHFSLPRWLPTKGNLIQNSDGSQFVFRINHNFFFENHREKAFIFFSLLIGIFVWTYFLIRKILEPVKWLKLGVSQVSQGNLIYTIPVTRNDELGDLSVSFNSMTQRIREMLLSRERLLLDVSHELRSPITRMKLALEFLPEDKTRKSIQDDILEVETMITEILESERIQNNHGGLILNPTNLSRLIQEVSRNFENRQPGIQLLNLPEKCVLNLDSERVKIVLKNLLENAFKYVLNDSQPINISVVETGEEIQVFIKDDGTGIPEEHLPFLFEPFYRVDQSRSKKTGGYGLGLNLCKKIMEAHGGAILIQNNSGRGVTVILKFMKSKSLETVR